MASLSPQRAPPLPLEDTSPRQKGKRSKEQRQAADSTVPVLFIQLQQNYLPIQVEPLTLYKHVASLSIRIFFRDLAGSAVPLAGYFHVPPRRACSFC